MLHLKTTELLYSMAMRSNHAFGLLNFEKKRQILNQMNNFYDLVYLGLSNEEIAANEKIGMDLITVSQVREEIQGKGFYKEPK